MAINTAPRIDVSKVTPQTYEPVLNLEKYIHTLGLGESLLEFLKLRSSQINGCAYCVDMHSRRLRELGEPNERIDAVAAWSEGPFFDERERAALAWAEAVTLVSHDHIPDDVYQAARSQFSERDLVNLTLAVATINVWNRLAIAFRAVPDGYKKMKKTGAAAAKAAER